MPAASLDDFMAFNDQLAALAEAEMPLELGLGSTAAETSNSLERINASVARRVAGGASLEEALSAGEPPLSASYALLVREGLLRGNLDRQLSEAARSTEASSQLQSSLRTAFIYPLIVGCLALIGLALFAVYLTPVFAGVHAEFRIPDGPGLKLLSAIRTSLPYWGLVLLVVAAAALWRLRPGRRANPAERGLGFWRRLPGASQAAACAQQACFAERLAAMLKTDVPLSDGLRQIADHADDRQLANAAKRLSAALRDEATFEQVAPQTDVLPPLLRWAVVHADDAPGRARSLEIAADVYRQWAAEWSERSRIGVPMVAGILIGGGATLIYGLTLFLPITELLSSLSQY